MDYIFTRRSIRQYTQQHVDDAEVEYLLRAGMAAPSAKNIQPWSFIVIRSRETLDKIADLHQYGNMLKNTPLAILVCSNAQPDKLLDYWIEDCSAATQNILLAAHSKGLGAVWLGVYPTMDRTEMIKEIMGIPDGVLPFSLISIGYPAETREPADRYTESKVHYEKW